MFYQITTPPTAVPEKQADELGRLLKHSKQLIIQFVTVAGRYKPARARMMLLSVPDRVADQAARVMQVLAERDDSAVKPSAAVRQRAEWTQHALFAPADPLADPPDGALLDGWDSACLTVIYQPGRAVARLTCCPEDADRLAKLSLPGWRLTVRPGSFARMFAGGAWRGVPSFVPVRGGVTPAPSRAPAPEPQALDTPPPPLAEEVAAVLTKADNGLLLGVAPDGDAVRLARRAMTLALIAPSELRQTAILSLMRRGMQAGLGIVVAVDRALLPSEALSAWEARVRLLDVQDVASSCAIPWRQVDVDLLGQAIVGPAGKLDAQPARFAAALDELGAGALRVPAVLGLVAAPGDDLRGVLAAGGLVVVPQDGDAASTVVARLLMAYLATPPAIGRAVLMIVDPALVSPAALRDQVIQVVLGERGDALLRMASSDAGWRLSGPDGSHVADMLHDLMAQPASGTSELVETIIREIGAPAPVEAPVDEAPGWWDGGQRNDDLDMPDVLNLSGEAEQPPTDVKPALDTLDVPGDQPLHPTMAAPLIEAAPVVQIAPGADADQPASDLDAALDGLLNALMADEHQAADGDAIREAIAREAFDEADTLSLEWVDRASEELHPWCWRVVLAQEDRDRAIAAWRALQQDPEGVYAPLLRAVLDSIDTEPAGGLAQVDAPANAAADTGAVPFGDTPLPLDDKTAGGLLPIAEALLQSDDAADLSGWPVLLDDVAEGREHGTPLATNGWEALDNAPLASAEEVRPDAEHAGLPALPVAAEPPNNAIPAADHGIPASAVAPFMPAVTPVMQPQAPAAASTAAEALNDAAIRATWEAGASIPSLVARLTATGVDAATARARVRQAVSVRSGEPAAPAIVAPPIASRLVVEPAPMNGIETAFTAASELGDEAIWQRWQAGEKTDDLIQALCGRRGGPKADAARDRVYLVVIPRIVAELNADDLVDRLAAGQEISGDPRYPVLMQRLARSETPPAGMLERSLRKRLIAARQEV